MALTQQDIDKKLAFFNITGDDVARFGQISGAMDSLAGPALERLYDRIALTPDTGRFFSSRQAMNHARDKQIESKVVADAIKQFDINPEKVNPAIA